MWDFLTRIFRPTVDIVALKQSITQAEGTVSWVYDDATGEPIVKGYMVKGNPTIGIGRLLTKVKGLSNDEIQNLLTNDINTILMQVVSTNWWPHVSNNDARSRAIVEMVFNLGLTGFEEFKEAIDCLEKDDFVGAANNFTNSEWAKQVGVRATRLTNMISTGKD